MKEPEVARDLSIALAELRNGADVSYGSGTMRFLGIGDSCDLGALYLRLLEAGHEVKTFVADPMCHGTLAGMVERTSDWQAELGWIGEAGPDGIILFENVAERRGALQDHLRRQGFHVVGGSAFGDRLENDRKYAQETLSGIGLSTARTWEFNDVRQAQRFIAAHPARYVLKFNGPGFSAADNYIGQLQDGRDVAAVLGAKLRGRDASATGFVLMERVFGVEMGIGAYFNGRRFLMPACLDWEHKRFFAGDLGELTGEMGTVVTYDRTRRFFDMTLGHLEAVLRQHGHCGYVNLNTIVNEDGIWPLEFTCRFGYPGFAILDSLQETSWAALFRAMVHGTDLPVATRPGFSVGVVLTTPPFPYTRKQVKEVVGLPVFLDADMSPDDRRHLHFGEVGLQDGQLTTSGIYGWMMVVTGLGPTPETAKQNAYRLAGKVHAPNMRYRLDIGDNLVGGELARVERMGLLDLG